MKYRVTLTTERHVGGGDYEPAAIFSPVISGTLREAIEACKGQPRDVSVLRIPLRDHNGIRFMFRADDDCELIRYAVDVVAYGRMTGASAERVRNLIAEVTA